MKKVFTGLLVLAIAGCNAPQEATNDFELLTTEYTERLDAPFSEAARVGNLLFLSGKIGNVPGTRDLVPGGIEAQTRQTMENIRRSLESFGSSLDKVAKCTIFIADMADWPAMNDVYASFFETPPARSSLGASGLALGALVEIECIAVVG